MTNKHINSPNNGKGLVLETLSVIYRLKLWQRFLGFIGGLDKLIDAMETGQCLEWQGLGGSNGYGQISINGEKISAHKLAYALMVGNVPAGTVVMHTCDNPRCVNPNHLRLGTQADNIFDAKEKGRLKRSKPKIIKTSIPRITDNNRKVG